MERITRRSAVKTMCAFAALVVGECIRLPVGGAYLTVDEARCSGCGECTRVCDADALRIIAGKAVLDAGKCIECGKCIEVCPTHAIM